MNKIRLDFAAPALERSIYRTSFPIWICLLIGLTVCISASLSCLQINRQLNIQMNKLQQVQSNLTKRNEWKLVIKKSAITDAQASAVNDAVSQLNLPWNALFDALEGATPQSIAVLSIEPDALRHSVRGIAEAKDSEEMVHYIEQLKKQSLFTNVFITMHDINQMDPNKPMRFQFEAYWKGSAS